MAKPIYMYNSITLGANARGTITLQGGEGETITLSRMYFTSTGSFSVLRIRTSGGMDYVSDQKGSGIPNNLFTTSTTATDGTNTFIEPIDIAPAELLYVEVVNDTGSNNTVGVLFVGIRE